MTKGSNKSIYSFLNALSAMVMTLANGFLGIIVTRFIISEYGSDFNGLNSTANQIINVLLILEGGFTLASNVALFSPLTNRDYKLVNGLLAATKSKFRKIGLLFLGIGSVIAIGYSFVVNSSLPREFVVTLIMMTVIPAAFNLFYATTYRVLLQSQQKEYVISLITTLTLSAGHISNIIMIICGGPMWAVRFITMSFAIANSFLIAGYVRHKNKFINFKEPPRPDLIKGTGDVMAQKITGVIYNSAPIVFLSISPTGGTMLASVYAVYNNVFTMVKSLLHAVIDAPRLGFGQMLTERKRDDVWGVYAQYEYAAFNAIFVMLTTCCALILPFVKLYTNGITDAVYYDKVIAVTMVLIAATEMIHIPSGHLINMAGEFKIARNFQIISCVSLIVLLIAGGIIFGVYGMLFALLAVAVLLAFLEIGYIHTRFFRKKLLPLMRLLLPLIVSGAVICFFEMQLPIKINGYITFIFYGGLLAVINTVAAVIIGLIFNRKQIISIFKRFKGLVLK